MLPLHHGREERSDPPASLIRFGAGITLPSCTCATRSNAGIEESRVDGGLGQPDLRRG